MIQSECFIYSRSSTEWIRGHISNIFIDEVTNAEWMVVRYGQKTKRIQRFNVCLRPIDGGDVDYNELFVILTPTPSKLEGLFLETSSCLCTLQTIPHYRSSRLVSTQQVLATTAASII